MQQVIRSPIPPKGVRRNVEGVVLFDCEGEGVTMESHNDEELSNDDDCQVNENVDDAIPWRSRTEDVPIQSASAGNGR